MTDVCDTPSPNPRTRTPDENPCLRPPAQPGRSLVEQLSPVYDAAQALVADIGLRPYRVFAVRTRWTGGDVGRGNQVLVSETEYLPTPQVRYRQQGEQESAGFEERGRAELRKLSTRYTEAEIRGVFGDPLGPAEEAFIESRMDARDGRRVLHRRFTIASAPQRIGFEWRVDIRPQDNMRTRSGQLPSLPRPARQR